MVWNGFKGIGTKDSIVANCATIPHDPLEIERKSAFDTAFHMIGKLNINNKLI